MQVVTFVGATPKQAWAVRRHRTKVGRLEDGKTKETGRRRVQGLESDVGKGRSLTSGEGTLGRA